jgi:hypothetical protein
MGKGKKVRTKKFCWPREFASSGCPSVRPLFLLERNAWAFRTSALTQDPSDYVKRASILDLGAYVLADIEWMSGFAKG